MSEKIWLGIDVGSISVKTVVVANSGEILSENYARHNGRPTEALQRILTALEERFDPSQVRAGAITGSGGQDMAQALGVQFINEVIALTTALAWASPQAHTVIEMGGQDSKLLILEEATDTDKQALRDFSMNSLCAAGTGSFLDQQATRLGVDIEEEFAELALRSSAPPRIAGRCSVFAKSDMIHLQQIATPVEDIAAGLCLALARSFKSTVGKGMAFDPPVAFVGGVASNEGMRHAFEEALSLEPGALLIPPHHRTLGAIGAVRKLLETDTLESPTYRGSQGLGAQHNSPERGCKTKHLQPLRPFLTAASTPSDTVQQTLPDGKTRAYLGIDVGSISTNVVAIDEQGRVLAKRYLRTASRPIEAVQQGLAEVCDEVGDHIEVDGVATTGSGRYLTGELVGADIIRNEITAQATAAIFIDPKVDTIFEIGGQDSKYIRVDNGAVSDFEMNRACAAGTGSFLEEQAERLSLDIKNEFSQQALDAPRPVALGDRCTVFMESDLIHHQAHGACTPDLLAGLSYSIVHNYLNRVVGDRRVGERIFFQGGTAFNKAVVAAFNSVTGKEITVPPHHEVTGAIGAALLALRHAQNKRAIKGYNYQTSFRGFDFSQMDFQVRLFTCRECENLCEIRTIKMEGSRPVYYGSRCEKYDVDRHAATTNDIPDLFAERKQLLIEQNIVPAPNAKTIGIPMALPFHDSLPLWRTFFEVLGFRVILSDATTKRIIRSGVESVSFETCYPVKIAHGHILDLLDKKPDYLFLPCLIDAPPDNDQDAGKDRVAFNCPLVQTIPYTSRSSIDFEATGIPVLSPALHLQWGMRKLEKSLMPLAKQLGSSKKQIRAALAIADKAQRHFEITREKKGKELLAQISPERPGLVIVARPYNGCDEGLNLDLARKLRNMGVVPIPMDMLPLSETPLPRRWGKVYWRYGRRILKAAEIIRNNTNLYAVYVTNFSCGPDSFLLEFFRKEMSGKPYLQLEIDEHSADAGLVTRCEAFLDTLANLHLHDNRITATEDTKREFSNHRQLFVPNMSPHAHALAAAFRASGINATVMDASDEETQELGRRHTSGRECYPCLLTTGNIVRETQRPGFDREKVAFFMASADGPCRFGQYNQLQRMVLDQLGYTDVPIFTLDQDRDYHQGIEGLASGFERKLWQGVVAVDLLEKTLLNTRPYETETGQTDHWFEESLEAVADAIERGNNALWEILPRLERHHASIGVDRSVQRPLIGVVGEVYVRTNAFANNHIFEAIEALGCEVSAPTMSEWIAYTNIMRTRHDREQQNLTQYMKDLAAKKFMEHDENKIYKYFGKKPDAGPEDLFRLANPYLSPKFEGEAILTIGKTVELIGHQGAAGIVNTMPFTCMPGAICTALLKRVREEMGEFPVFNAAFTGQQELNNQARLEAFVYQARQYHDKHQTSVTERV